MVARTPSNEATAPRARPWESLRGSTGLGRDLRHWVLPERELIPIRVAGKHSRADGCTDRRRVGITAARESC